MSGKYLQKKNTGLPSLGESLDIFLLLLQKCFLFSTKVLGHNLGLPVTEVFLCFITIVFILSIVLTSLFSLFYVTREHNRFLHRG